MIIEEMKEELEKHRDKPDIIKIWYLKEFLQTIVLKEIYEFPECRDLLFYGGTASRFLLWLNRLSEDLDFACAWFEKFEELWLFLQHRLKNYGLIVDYKIQKFRLTLKLRDLLKDFNMQYGNSSDLYLKIEISEHTEFLKNFEIKIYPLFKHHQSLVLKSFDEESLFSTKLNAVLYRKREKKKGEIQVSIKGRDFYDLFWYLQRGTKPNISCIEGIKDLEDLKNKLIETVTNTDFNEIEQDIKNFVEDQNIITFIKNNGKSYLLEQIEKR